MRLYSGMCRLPWYGGAGIAAVAGGGVAAEGFAGGSATALSVSSLYGVTAITAGSGCEMPVRSCCAALAVCAPFCAMPAAFWASAGVTASRQAAAMQTSHADLDGYGGLITLHLTHDSHCISPSAEPLHGMAARSCPDAQKRIARAPLPAQVRGSRHRFAAKSQAGNRDC